MTGEPASPPPANLEEYLTDSLLSLHFSDEESDRLLYLDQFEAEAVARYLAPMVQERLTMAHHDGYVDGWNERGEDL